MAITRRQFVTTLGALAAAMGVGQSEIASITEAFAHSADYNGTGPNNWADKPKVIWVHGAECTGCSTSLLSLFEDVRGKAIEGMNLATADALDLAVDAGGSGTGWPAVLKGTADGGQANHPYGHRTLQNTGYNVDGTGVNGANGIYAANIADVLIDFIDLQYHETVMGMGGDLAYQWLADNMYNGSSLPFVLVVEGAVQAKDNLGMWNSSGSAPWCAIGMDDTPGADYVKGDTTVVANDGEHSFDDVVKSLAVQDNCAAVISIGQCACYGGYPAAKSPVLNDVQTGAQGVHDFLTTHGAAAAADKVINVPGCPANPWWFVLTVVAWMVDYQNPGTLGVLENAAPRLPKASAIDNSRRLKAVFGTPVHGPACPRYQQFLNGVFATKPGDPGCLQLLGCKGPSTNSLCNVHGWNSMQPNNDATWENGLVRDISKGRGSACPMAGAPCMGCTEKGYPDAFVPFVVR